MIEAIRAPRCGFPPRPGARRPAARRGREAAGFVGGAAAGAGSGVDLRQLRGTSPAGRILHDDLDAFLRGAATPFAAAGRAENTGAEDVKVMGLRRPIARSMAESTRRVAHFSYVEEVDVTALGSSGRR